MTFKGSGLFYSSSDLWILCSSRDQGVEALHIKRLVFTSLLQSTLLKRKSNNPSFIGCQRLPYIHPSSSGGIKIGSSL